jgi:hypothetical protein
VEEEITMWEEVEEDVLQVCLQRVARFLLHIYLD